MAMEKKSKQPIKFQVLLEETKVSSCYTLAGKASFVILTSTNKDAKMQSFGVKPRMGRDAGSCQCQLSGPDANSAGSAEPRSVPANKSKVK